MLRGLKSILFLSISMCYAVPCYAQFIDDIPLFDDVKETKKEEKKAPPEKPVTAPKPEQTPAPSPNVEAPKPPEPNIGRKAIPLDKLVLTPAPLPEVSIDLQDNVSSEPLPNQPPPRVNTRQESITIPPMDNGETPQPSALVNVHDVRQFDIEEFSLGMLPKEVVRTAIRKGYKLIKAKKAIPLFQTTHYDTLCRQSGVYVPDKLRDCIRGYAQQNKQDYVEEIILEKKATRESFQFNFTSPATGNELFRIVYRTRGDNSLAFTRPNVVKKLNRKEAFFNAVFNMYGYPDDNNKLVWGSPEDAYMQVSMSGSSYDGTIILNDTKLSNEDYFAASDWKAETETPYHFGFDE